MTIKDIVSLAIAEAIAKRIPFTAIKLSDGTPIGPVLVK